MQGNIEMLNQQEEIILKKLDSYLFAKIVSYLDTCDIERLYQTKPSIFSFSDLNIWEHIVKDRKLHYFLVSQPVLSYEEQVQEYSNSCTIQPAQESIIDIIFSDSGTIEKHFAPLIMDTNKLDLLNLTSQNWRQVFRKYHNKIVYSGKYIGNYDSHGNEILQAFQLGYFVIFIKITGDPNVPLGKITFYMNLTEDLKKGIGRIHLAEAGYLSPRWGQASIKIKEKANNPLKNLIEGEENNQIYKQIKIDWFIKNIIMLTFTQRLRFAVWKENSNFQIKSKQKFLNIMFRDINFGRNFSFTTSRSPEQLFEDQNQ